MHNSEVSKCAHIYALIHSLECLEKAYLRGIVIETEYVKECSKLINKCLIFKESNEEEFSTFLENECSDCLLAKQRLASGHPVNADLITNETPKKERLIIFELTGFFITLMDALMLGKSAVDEIYPFLHDIVTSVKKLDSDYKYRKFIKSSPVLAITNWYARLNSMEATEQLSASEIRQLTLDLEKCYNCLKESLDD